MTNPTLTEARRALKHWSKEVERLQDERCAKYGHAKGERAFAHYFYCKCCGGQIADWDFRKKPTPLPVIDPSLLEVGK